MVVPIQCLGPVRRAPSSQVEGGRGQRLDWPEPGPKVVKGGGCDLAGAGESKHGSALTGEEGCGSASTQPHRGEGVWPGPMGAKGTLPSPNLVPWGKSHMTQTSGRKGACPSPNPATQEEGGMAWL